MDGLVEEQVALAKEYYQTLYKKEKFETPQDAVRELIQKPAAEVALQAYQGILLEKKPTLEEVVEKNVFWKKDTKKADWDNEVASRTEEAPYVVSKQEYMDNENEYMQISLTYFEGDGVLVDERDDVIEETDGLVGDDNLVRFGDWSDDPNVVYVRNHLKELDIEINRSRGKYSEEVAGL